MTLIYNKSKHKTLRQKLRSDVPTAERILWNKLRRNQLNVKFRRQYGISRYVCDFYNAEYKLVIELDGDSHFTPEAENYDAIRNEYMHNLGMSVLRFTNQDVMSNIDSVLEYILMHIEQLKSE
ncbi:MULTISPECIES: endonuclease domain-containing protein [Aliivibrio]|uniref:Endonuclease domain-containing protein n=1 Tax=Aliivibrio finisterrensis TaxID=511998 RepID=A0A4Q5KDC1_9GAMM|nr:MULTISPECIES: endonuclease domain-containing protein [Aliivibrio]MDD9179656.1 endonuclease domain-containing protein [Aliivibrio sp. A6]RYU44017.1 endonuclease domain-containing protein [Aliivibrio finisterrensis]RYU49243.1 endonuclease domain-containing protein [Aliivibrio finisterrensis]RYU49668.1 endonuclease domain-containing protein [Aliivibrio finisterrensis]RYU57111.1 endonuclease domain-containing protein [Aliivibrio finisterrensis]